MKLKKNYNIKTPNPLIESSKALSMNLLLFYQVHGSFTNTDYAL